MRSKNTEKSSFQIVPSSKESKGQRPQMLSIEQAFARAEQIFQAKEKALTQSDETFNVTSARYAVKKHIPSNPEHTRRIYESEGKQYCFPHTFKKVKNKEGEDIILYVKSKHSANPLAQGKDSTVKEAFSKTWDRHVIKKKEYMNLSPAHRKERSQEQLSYLYEVRKASAKKEAQITQDLGYLEDKYEANHAMYLVTRNRGQNAFDYVRKNKLTGDQKLDGVVQVCNIIRKMHEKDIAHRDFKLENVVVDSLGVYTPIDFGFSEYGLNTAPNILAGSLPFLPSKLKGNKKNLDIFALMRVIYMPKEITLLNLENEDKPRKHILENDEATSLLNEADVRTYDLPFLNTQNDKTAMERINNETEKSIKADGYPLKLMQIFIKKRCELRKISVEDSLLETSENILLINSLLTNTHTLKPFDAITAHNIKDLQKENDAYLTKQSYLNSKKQTFEDVYKYLYDNALKKSTFLKYNIFSTVKSTLELSYPELLTKAKNEAIANKSSRTVATFKMILFGNTDRVEQSEFIKQISSLTHQIESGTYTDKTDEAVGLSQHVPSFSSPSF